MDTILLTAALTIFVFMVIMFLIAQAVKDNSIVDIGWGIGFVLVSAACLYQAEAVYARQWLMMGMIAAWGLRLAGYIGKRNIGKGEDYRYAQWRKEWGKWVVVRAFFQVFMLQGFFMWVVALPIMMVHANPTAGIGPWEVAGATLWTVGFFFEAVGDWQKSQFKKKAENKNKLMTTGLWKYTRHPNYFGEAVMWWGVFIVAIPAGWWYVSLVSPVVLSFLLVKVSGVAMLEKSYEGRPGWEEYKQRTSAFFPLPPRN